MKNQDWITNENQDWITNVHIMYATQTRLDH